MMQAHFILRSIIPKPWLLFLAVAFLTLGGCLDTREEIKARQEQKVLQSQVVEMQRSGAESTARQQELEEQFRSLNGRLESLENQLAKISAQLEGSATESQKNHGEASEKINLLTESLVKVQKQVEELEQQAQAAQAAAQAVEAQTKINRETAGVNKNSWTAANEEFERKNWKKAIVAFEKYRTNNPKGKHYPVATLRIGSCFSELGMHQEARAFYDEVIAKFPKSTEAGKAKKALAKLQ